jgi:hypothetical protein
MAGRQGREHRLHLHRQQAGTEGEEQDHGRSELRRPVSDGSPGDGVLDRRFHPLHHGERAALHRQPIHAALGKIIEAVLYREDPGRLSNTPGSEFLSGLTKKYGERSLAHLHRVAYGIFTLAQ